MKSAIEQSIKEKIKALAKERETTFAELWRNLILERFLTRLARSSYKEKFILKGGTLLAKYIHIGRETQDLDFFIQELSNTQQSLRTVLQAICDINANDSFSFGVAKSKSWIIRSSHTQELKSHCRHFSALLKQSCAWIWDLEIAWNR
jgi:predicted nucleotidyltransferase component of viral defense system